jgi:hypothetical protein
VEVRSGQAIETGDEGSGSKMWNQKVKWKWNLKVY